MKLHEMAQAMIEYLAANLSAPKKQPKEWACQHCHSDLHTGGPAKCPLKDFSTKVCRRMAKEAERRIKDKPDVLTRLIAEEKARE
jgi:hypothetical protein